MELAIVGSGYVGLVTAACLAHLGHSVSCTDIDAVRIDGLKAGRLPFHEPGLDELVIDGLAKRRLRFSAEPTSIRGADLVIVCVGTLDASEEWTARVVHEAVLAIARDRSAPRRIVIRSTLLPGTARDVEREARKIDETVRIAHNPEFTKEATAVSDFLRPDRVVIGVDDQAQDPTAADLADALRHVYAPLAAPILVTDLTSAETVKLASNVYLAAKVTFANELARLCAATGADVADVVDGMGMDARIVRSFLSPGPGFGGSCFPSQARALPDLAQRYGVEAPLMAAVWPSNLIQSEWLLDRLEAEAGSRLAGMRVALLGLTFKAGTDDLRESPSLRLGAALLARGAQVVAFDPVALDEGVAQLVAEANKHGAAAARVEKATTAEAACEASDAVVVATEWPEFALLDWPRIASTMRGRIVADGRRIVDLRAATEAGLRVLSLGVGVAASPVAPVALG